MSKITLYSNGIDRYREAIKAVTPRIEEPIKIEKEQRRNIIKVKELIDIVNGNKIAN